MSGRLWSRGGSSATTCTLATHGDETLRARSGNTGSNPGQTPEVIADLTRCCAAGETTPHRNPWQSGRPTAMSHGGLNGCCKKHGNLPHDHD